ncbi:MAG: IS30 family transposase, partial [Francisella sp.]
DIEKETGMTVYFARAYASWQRGTNENTNGLLRQFIPKGTDFDTVSDDDLAKYVDLINNRPRKRLNWLSPNQVFDKELNSVTLGTGI